MAFFLPPSPQWSLGAEGGNSKPKSHRDVAGRALAWDMRHLGHWACDWPLGVSGSRPVIKRGAFCLINGSVFTHSRIPLQHPVYSFYSAPEKRLKLLLWIFSDGQGAWWLSRTIPRLNDPGRRCLSFCLPRRNARLTDLQRSLKTSEYKITFISNSFFLQRRLREFLYPAQGDLGN